MTTFCIVFYESYLSRQTVTKYDVANLLLQDVMVDRLIKRGNFDDKTEAIEKRCATFQVNIERGITRRPVFAGRHLIEWTTMVRMVNAIQKDCI
jgi:hypothetical protein